MAVTPSTQSFLDFPLTPSVSSSFRFPVKLFGISQKTCLIEVTHMTDQYDSMSFRYP